MRRQSAHPFADMPPGSLRVLQITDTHLYADAQRGLLGLNTLDSLDQVIRIAQQELNMVDVVLATGDLVHDASAEGYARLRKRLSRLRAPVYCLPGNHDSPSVMRQHITGPRVHMTESSQAGVWNLVFLDSTIPGEDGGDLRPAELDRLRSALAQNRYRPTLICLHHHPIPVGSTWMDSMALANASELFTLIDSHPQVKGVLCGHVHQEFDSYRNHVRFLASPSTCIQFAPGTDHFEIDPLPPGYRWLALLPNGEIRTGVKRLEAVSAEIDMMSVGY